MRLSLTKDVARLDWSVDQAFVKPPIPGSSESAESRLTARREIE